MNAKISVFVICVEMITYLLLYNCMTVSLNLSQKKLLQNLFMSLEPILKIEISRNLFMRIQAQNQNFAEFIFAIKRTSTSQCFSIINASSKIDIWNGWEIGKDLELDKTKISGSENSWWGKFLVNPRSPFRQIIEFYEIFKVGEGVILYWSLTATMLLRNIFIRMTSPSNIMWDLFARMIT